VVRRHWNQREELRDTYEAEHGEDPDEWSHRHPGIVIGHTPRQEAAALSMEGVHQICEKCDKVLFADDPIKRA
jgi:hypothetical protein